MIAVAVLPGDGVGPEVIAGPSALLAELSTRGVLTFTGPWPIGTTGFAETGHRTPAETLAACEASDAILLGAVGDHPGIDEKSYPGLAARAGSALGDLRELFDLRVSIRKIWRGDAVPFTVVRNLLGGAYGGRVMRRESVDGSPAGDVLELEPDRIREVAHIAADYVEATGAQFISADKASLLATSRLWRRVASGVAEERRLPVRHVYVDRMAFELAAAPPPEAVLLTEGIFGDMLSDAACGRAGSIALAGSASVRPPTPNNTHRCIGLFEPVHGSAPLHAGANRVNPIGGYLALAALLDWFPETRVWAQPIRGAVARVLAEGPLTYDMTPQGSHPATTTDVSEHINDVFAVAAAEL
jgi:isocitrate/isopropylmalate dehydrogenase